MIGGILWRVAHIALTNGQLKKFGCLDFQRKGKTAQAADRNSIFQPKLSESLL